MSDSTLLLTTLQDLNGEWLTNPYSLRIMVHSRVSDLRRKGHRIESRRFGKSDYRYRLLPPTQGAGLAVQEQNG